MHSRYRHFIPAFALALTASCSPIAYVDFPDGGGEEGGKGGQPMTPTTTPTTTTKKPLALARMDLPVSNGPLPSMAPGIELNLTLADPACPLNLADKTTIAFNYGDKCSRGTGVHEVSCRYSIVPNAGGPSSSDSVSALRFHEEAVLPYVIHSGMTGEFNAIYAVGTMRVTYHPPGKPLGTQASLLLSTAKSEPAVSPGIDINTSTESVNRDSMMNFPQGTLLSDIVEIRVSATVQCIARRTESRNMLPANTACDKSQNYQCREIPLTQIDRAETGTLLSKDAINPFSWKLSGFSVDATAR